MGKKYIERLSTRNSLGDLKVGYARSGQINLEGGGRLIIFAIMIVAGILIKDELDYIDGCLCSLIDMVDKVVLVATDISTYNSLAMIIEEVEPSFTIAYFHNEWDGNFSNARNFVLGKALDVTHRGGMGEGSNWIIMIDPDERLVSNGLREYILGLDDRVGGLGVRIINPQREEANNMPCRSQVVWSIYTRIFRLSEDIRYTGEVHEQISTSILGSSYQVEELSSDIGRIHHLGYEASVGILKGKASRNLVIMEKELREGKRDGRIYYHLGLTHAILGNTEKGVDAFIMALGIGNIGNDRRSDIYERLGMYYWSKGELEEARGLFMQGMKEEPNNVGVREKFSKLMLAMGDKGRARKAIAGIEGYRGKELERLRNLLGINEI